MAFIVGFVCFLFACAVILTIQVRNTRRIQCLERDLEFQKTIILELNHKLQSYEQEKTKSKKGKGKKPGQQTS
jgi:hypothetical protein